PTDPAIDRRLATEASTAMNCQSLAPCRPQMICCWSPANCRFARRCCPSCFVSCPGNPRIDRPTVGFPIVDCRIAGFPTADCRTPDPLGLYPHLAARPLASNPCWVIVGAGRAACFGQAAVGGLDRE